MSLHLPSQDLFKYFREHFCSYVGMFFHSSRTIAPEKNCPAILKLTLTLTRGREKEQFPLVAIVQIPFLTISATIEDVFSQRVRSYIV